MHHTFSHKHPSTAGIRLVAMFEGAKGLLVLLVGFGLLMLVGKNVHEAAVELVKHIHLNPARHLPTVFLDLSERVSDTQLWASATAALLYSVIRFAEAVGLWLQRRWAEWFGVLTGGMYIPIELYEVGQGVNWAKMTVLLVNIVVVLYLLRVLARTRRYERNLIK